MKPDAQKTWTEQKKDEFVGTGDSLASSVQPHGNKSTTQKLADTFTPDNHNAIGDSHRQGLGDKIAAKAKPDSEKTTTEHVGDAITGKSDKVVSHAQPESSKTTTQKITDAVTPGNDSTATHGHAHPEHRGVVDKVKDALHIGHGSHANTHAPTTHNTAL